METDFWAFFLVVELLKLEWNHFFLRFSDTLASNSFFYVQRVVFYNEIFHSSWWKKISGHWKPFSFIQSLFLEVEIATEITGSQFLKKDHILTI